MATPYPSVNRLNANRQPGTSATQPLRDGTGTTPPDTAKPGVSPALSAMGYSGAATSQPNTQPGQRGLAPAGSQAGGNPNTPTVAPPPRPDLITPAQATATPVNTQANDRIYADRLAQSDRDRQTMMDVGNNTISSLQRRNASNAALSGFSVGGGSYLGGQRSAAVAGINAFNQGLLNWGNQRQNLYSGQGNIAASAATTNANAATNVSQTNTSATNSANQFNANRNATIDDSTAAADATRTANNFEDTITNLQGDLSSYGVDVAGHRGSTNALASDLMSAARQATPGSPEQQAALQKIDRYKNKLDQAKQLYNSGGGKKGNFSLGGKNYSNISFDDYLKYQEQLGFFNGI